MPVIQSKPNRAVFCLMAGLVGLSVWLGEPAPPDDSVARRGSRMEQGVSSMSSVEAGVAQADSDPGAVMTTGVRRDVLVVAVLRALDAGHVPFGGPVPLP